MTRCRTGKRPNQALAARAEFCAQARDISWSLGSALAVKRRSMVAPLATGNSSAQTEAVAEAAAHQARKMSLRGGKAEVILRR